MSHHHHRYYGPGSNIRPAIKYLKDLGAVSEGTAISLENIKSEEFRRLLELNGQTSGLIGVTPDGKYWVREKEMKALNIVFIIILVLFGSSFLFISLLFTLGVLGALGTGAGFLGILGAISGGLIN